MSEELLPQALDLGQVCVIVSACTQARWCRSRVVHAYCKPASRGSMAAQLSTPVSAARDQLVHRVGVCVLPRPSRSCHAAELPIVQPDIRHSTDVRSAPGAQVDPLSLGITEGIPFVLSGFRNVLVRAHRMCLAALGPTVHHHRRSRSQV